MTRPGVATLLVCASVAAAAQQPAEGRLTEESAAMTQISDQSDIATDAMQLTPARSSGRQPQAQPQQVNRSGPTAQPPQALSTRQEGRTTDVQAVHGADRCDPEADKLKRSAQCATVIESRAGEYRRPPATALSAEQKLLLERQLRGAGKNAADATERLARSGTSDSLETMGMAAIVLEGARQQERPKDEESLEGDPTAQAIIQILSQTPPPN